MIDLTNYPLEAPGSVTVSRKDIMNNGLLLVNEWHSRPEDFDDSAVVALATYARQAGLDSFWENGSVKLFPVAVDALVAALTDAKAAGYEHFVVSADNSYRSWNNQNERFQKQVEYYRSRYPNNTEEQLVDRAKKYVNYPGTSDYHTGMSFRMDVYQRGNAELNDQKFQAESKQGRQLRHLQTTQEAQPLIPQL